MIRLLDFVVSGKILNMKHQQNIYNLYICVCTTQSNRVATKYLEINNNLALKKLNCELYLVFLLLLMIIIQLYNI